MVERTDERRAADMNNLNPQHLKNWIKIWNGTAFAGTKRATSIYRDATTYAARPITSKNWIFGNLDNAIGVLLFQMCFADDGDIDVVSDEFEAKLFEN